MTRTQDFNNCVLYHIRFKKTKVTIYVGSTTHFPQRQRNHKYRCTNEKQKEYNLPLYKYIRANGSFDDFEVVPIKCFSCNNKTELLLEEQKEIDNHDTLYNGCRAYTDTKEYIKQYRIENRTEIKEYNKQYHHDHREERMEKEKQKVTCECGCVVSKWGLSNHKKTKKHIKWSG